jgi:nitric oxide reductase NorD protein
MLLSNAPAERETCPLPQRGLSAYLRTLWNLDVTLWPTSLSTEEADLPFIAPDGLHLPASHAFESDWYRAAAAHAAAHNVYSRHVFDSTGLAPVTRALVGVLEDARVEWLACRELPGLRRLWLAHHDAVELHGTGFEALSLRLARSLLDPHCADDHPWVRKGRALFFVDPEAPPQPQAQALTRALALTQPAALRRAASLLGNDIGQMRLSFNAKLYRPGPSYRDDNRVLWQAHAGQSEAASNGKNSEQEASHDAPTPALPQQVVHYREWDRLISRYRPEWCSVIEAAPSLSTRAGYGHALNRAAMRPLQRALKSHATARSPLHARARQGSRMDLNALVAWAVDAHCLRRGDDRIYRARSVARPRTSWSVLIDVSASSAWASAKAASATSATGTTSSKSAHFSGLDLSASATAALTAAAAALGHGALDRDEIAVQSFCSNGRHAVFMQALKSFDTPLDAAALATLSGGLSTRLGAALRHTTASLAQRRSERRVVLLLSDGEPHDVDVHDPRYLVEDARRAVIEARQRGVRIVCLQLAAKLPRGADSVFNRADRVLLNRIEALPQAIRQLRL